ncbi:MAG: hypothetical protein K6T65_02545 [Peptococcaceae bacterium]|nr:hypothetical protein [Peptococcaceae bacterium]
MTLDPRIVTSGSSGLHRYLKKLLTGPWDDEFVVIEPGTNIALEHLRLDHRNLTSEKFLRLAR